MMHAFTVDVEDWFCSHNLQQAISYNDWDNLESRVERNTHSLLELLGRYRVHGTFFILGWVAERFPSLVRDIVSMGHEIGSHGYSHRLVTAMDPVSFANDVKLSVEAITSAAPVDVKGFRAPAFSITSATKWALSILRENGFAYDSSIYPIGYHPDYGMADAPLSIHVPIEGLKEIPMSCATMGIRIPCSGGAYLRLLPYAVFRRLVSNVITNGRPYIFYIHPWEIDKNMPRVDLPALKSFRHYTNLSSTLSKLERLLNEVEFTTLSNLLKNHEHGSTIDAKATDAKATVHLT